MGHKMREESKWDDLPTDPDPAADLGYEMEELTVIESTTDSKYIFLPADEAQLADEEFIVVSENTLCELQE